MAATASVRDWSKGNRYGCGFSSIARNKVSLGGLAIIEEMDSIAQAVLHDRSTRYDARTGRKDLELQIAVGESGRLGRVPLDLPLTGITPYEEGIHEHFKEKYGADAYDVEKLVDFFFPKV